MMSWVAAALGAPCIAGAPDSPFPLPSLSGPILTDLSGDQDEAGHDSRMGAYAFRSRLLHLATTRGKADLLRLQGERGSGRAMLANASDAKACSDRLDKMARRGRPSAMWPTAWSTCAPVPAAGGA
jgi:hypothetical protein